ncbi:unnamed protein product [Adineta steineri]|uniref:Uncharacterized protein n=2 Tax=Adineta steineri TaxID=433720 RepID=A0A814ICZ4_9BILA|nr:unnamed protein product [Adineta steineri]
MYIQVACLLVFLINSSRATIPDATIQADAAEITRLNRMVLYSSPPIFYKRQSLACEMINNCCPSIKSNFNEVTGEGTTAGPSAILNACIGSQPGTSFLKKCPMIDKLLPLTQDPEFLNYTVVLITAVNQMQLSDVEIEEPCTADETYAIYCKRNSRKEMLSCERKTLTYVAQHNSDDQYKTYIQEVKSTTRTLMKTMKNAFPKKNNEKFQKNQRYSYGKN